MDPKVTIGLPFYNNHDTLMAAIRSIFAQTYTEWELIIIDDGSTDGSGDIVRRITDSRVRVLCDGTNRGLAHRLNQISTLAQGKYVARMDADDLMHPKRIERQVEFLERNPNIDVVGTAAYVIDNHDNITGIRGMEPLGNTTREVLRRGLFIHPTVMGRVEWFRENPYRTTNRRAEDYELWCVTFNKSTFAKIDAPLLFYRDGEFRPRAYFQSLRDARDVLRRHGKELEGPAYTARLLARSYAKEYVVRLASMLGKDEWLVRRRNSRIEEAQLAEAVNALRHISNTLVPGDHASGL